MGFYCGVVKWWPCMAKNTFGRVLLEWVSCKGLSSLNKNLLFCLMLSGHCCHGTSLWLQREEFVSLLVYQLSILHWSHIRTKVKVKPFSLSNQTICKYADSDGCFCPPNMTLKHNVQHQQYQKWSITQCALVAKAEGWLTLRSGHSDGWWGSRTCTASGWARGTGGQPRCVGCPPRPGLGWPPRRSGSSGPPGGAPDTIASPPHCHAGSPAAKQQTHTAMRIPIFQKVMLFITFNINIKYKYV